MEGVRSLELDGLELDLDPGFAAAGPRVIAAILGLAESAVRRLHEIRRERGLSSVAALGRLRGTGRGVHFGSFIDGLEREMPLELQSPFEQSDRVAGAAWPAIPSQTSGGCCALAKLRWGPGADDLPMHVHDSDRFIIVHSGRGFFHVSGQPVDAFDGTEVRSIPARERDVFVFTRGTVHTFSTAEQPMTLLSCQLPFVPFSDPCQYRLPRVRWTARSAPDRQPARVACDPAWTCIAAVGSA